MSVLTVVSCETLCAIRFSLTTSVSPRPLYFFLSVALEAPLSLTLSFSPFRTAFFSPFPLSLPCKDVLNEKRIA